MKRNNRLVAIAVLLLAAAMVPMGLAGCTSKSGTSGKLQVVATMFPMADLARQAGGDLVEVTMLLPAGASPHTFEPTPEQVRRVATADVFVENGLGVDFWAETLLSSAQNPNMIKVVATDSIQPSQLIADTLDPGNYNPHVWNDPSLAQLELAAIRDAFIQADPANEGRYTANAAAYDQQLADLVPAINAELANLKSRDLVTFHNGFAYFARAFDLNQAAVIAEFPGTEPTPSYLQQVVTTIRTLSVPAVFAEAEFNPQAAQLIAQESGATVYTIDPEGGADPALDTLVKLLQSNAGVIRQGLG